VVYINFAFAKAEHIVEDFARYTHKIAITHHRILNIDKEKGTVDFSLKEYKIGAEKPTLTSF
jgi:Cu/Ag efflux protein CusF